MLHRLPSVLFGTWLGRLLTRVALGPLAVSAISLYFADYIAPVATLPDVGGFALALSLLVNVGPLRRAVVAGARGVAGLFRRSPGRSTRTASWLGGVWRRIRDIYGDLVESVGTSLYMIGDQLRYPGCQPQSARLVVGWLKLGLFVITYAARFAFGVVIEPTLNPVKHIPVMTVAGRQS